MTSGGSEAFPKRRRLLKRRDYLTVQQHGRKIHLRDLLVLFSPRQGLNRLGITASRKVGNAVKRNRIKRLIREVWRCHQRILPQGHDMVFIVKRGATTTHDSLLEQFKELARRLILGAKSQS